MISAFHQRYAQFAPILLSVLHKEIEIPAAEYDDKAVWLQRQRQLLRLSAELILVGIDNNYAELLKFLGRLLPEDDVNGPAHLPIASSFVRAVGPYFLKLDRQEDPLVTQLVSATVRAKFNALVTSYFKALCHLLVRSHQRFKTLQTRGKFYYEHRGDLSSRQTNELQESLEFVEKLRTNLQTLAESLGLSLPILDDEEITLEMIEGKVVFADLTIAKKEIKSLIYDSEEDRSFYEDTIDVRDSVPTLLFERTDANTDDDIICPEEIGEDLGEIPEIDPESIILDKKMDDSSIVNGDKSKTKLTKAFFEKLPNMRSRTLTDQAAIDYCYINSKTMQERLANTLIDLPYRRLDLLPFICRLLATLQLHFPLIPYLVVRSVIGQFTFLFHLTSPVMGTRSRVCRFIGELTKFRVMTQGTTYALLKRVILEDFTMHNVDMVAIILESCGRFLFHQPESHKRLQNLFEIIKKKQGHGMEVSQVIALDNAMYMCDPSAAPALKEKTPKSPQILFLHKLIRVDLSSNSVDKILLKILKYPWEEEKSRQELCRCFSKAWKLKPTRIAALAKLVASLQQYYPEFAIDIVDSVLEEIRSCLESSRFRTNQRLLLSVKYLGELCNEFVMQSDVIFLVLQILILHGHPEGLPRISNPSAIDAPDNHFRIRVICQLLHSCVKSLIDRPEMFQFINLFRYYVSTKTKLPMELAHVLDDTFHELGISNYEKHIGFEDLIERLIADSHGSLAFLREDVGISAESFTRGIEEEDVTLPTPRYSETNGSEEFDKAIAGMVSLGLEERKLEKRVGAFDTPIPLGLAKPSSGSKANDFLPGGLKMLVKKKNKVTIRELAVNAQGLSSISGRNDQSHK